MLYETDDSESIEAYEERLRREKLNRTDHGYILIVTNTAYPLGKWGDIDSSTEEDHDKFSNLLCHENLGRFLPSNTFYLKNPSTLEFNEELTKIGKKCTESDFLVIYWSGHVITVVNGDAANKKENSYFAFRNSIWGTPIETAETCMSLTRLCNILRNNPCRQKTVLLNYAHHGRPKQTYFASAKVQYPAPNVLTRLATEGHCAVIGSCTNGLKLGECLKYFPKDGQLREAYMNSEYLMNAQLPPLEREKMRAKSIPEKTKTKRRLRSEGISLFESDADNAELIKSNEKLANKFALDWESPPDIEIYKSPRPIKPSATWERDEGIMKINMPSTTEVKSISKKFFK